MDKKRLLNEFENELIKKGISRRDALKLMGVGAASTAMLNPIQTEASEAKASDVKAKIVIVGGGLAGISTAARLINLLSNPDVTIIEPSDVSVSYQPGNTFIGAGVYEKKKM